MGKAIYEDVHGAAEFAERTKSNTFISGMAFSALRIRPLPPPTNCASAAPALALCSAGYFVDSAVCSSEERAPSAYAVEVIWSS